LPLSHRDTKTRTTDIEIHSDILNHSVLGLLSSYGRERPLLREDRVSVAGDSLYTSARHARRWCQTFWLEDVSRTNLFSVYLGSEVILIDTQTVHRPGVL
jgi:hypothetical protein